MRKTLTIAVAGLLVLWAASEAMAQTRRAAAPRPQPTASPSNPYGLANCADRPFARDCDRRGTW